ncbi:MAG: hypothetical protein OXF94_11890, partial [Gammaproteobacteria bacterium]|nr:hypothetical protein [Gammaproteobacteria bacterium]
MATQRDSMMTDRRIAEAFLDAAKQAGQGEILANKLIKWFDAIASGNDGIGDAHRFVPLLYENTQLLSGSGG